MVARLTRLDQTPNVVLLRLHHLMLESEAGGSHFALIVEDDIERVLLAANTIALTTLRFNLDRDEERHLLVKAENGGRCASTGLIPNITCIDKVLERAHPTIDWRKDCVIQSGHF